MAAGGGRQAAGGDDFCPLAWDVQEEAVGGVVRDIGRILAARDRAGTAREVEAAYRAVAAVLAADPRVRAHPDARYVLECMAYHEGVSASTRRLLELQVQLRARVAAGGEGEGGGEGEEEGPP